MTRSADHASMVTKFEKVMVKLATLGHNPRTLTDCSEVIPVPKAVRLPPPTLPAGKTLRDVEAAVRLSTRTCPQTDANHFAFISAVLRPSPPSEPLPAPQPPLPPCTFGLIYADVELTPPYSPPS